MKTKFQIMWFDDDDSRFVDYKRVLEKGPPGIGLSASVTPVKVDRPPIEVLADQVADRARKRPPDLVMVDHQFSSAKPGKLQIGGSSIAQIARSSWPMTPMVCVTARMRNNSDFTQDQADEYVSTYDYSTLDQHVGELFAIARDFPLLAQPVRSKWIRLLKAPPDEAELLGRILPSEFSDLARPATPHRVARWILGTLMSRPGPLLDSLHSATLLGLNEQGFAKVAGLFDKAEYKGPFHTATRRRWWQSGLHGVLAALVGSTESTSQLAGRKLKSIVASDYSECHVGGVLDSPPEFVASADEHSSSQYPVCPRHASPDPRDMGVTPGFLSLYVVKGV